MRAPRFLRAAVAAAAALVLVGCASIPSSGPVREGNPVERDEDLGFAFRPQGPEEGDSPSEILAGFIAAGAGPQDNYQVARDFLTRDLATEWDPAAGVLVHARATTTLADSDTSLRLSVPATAAVDAAGRFDQFAEAQILELQFRFAQEGGEWRISQAPDGTVLGQAIFDRLFAERPLYFYDPTFTYLVPDLRWFPSTADAPTRIVEALLAGPADPLAPPVLATAFPEGTRLERQSVTPTDGQATVELGDEVVQADALTKQRMQFQLARSLVGGSILSVRISVDGTDLDIPESPSGTAPTVQPLVEPSALAGRDGEFGFLTGDDLEPLPGFSGAVSGLEPRAAVYSADDDLVAVLTGDGTVAAVRGGEDPVAVDTRENLLAPALDGEEFVWTIPGDAPDALLATRPGEDPLPVATGWSDATGVRSLAVSRDGARLLALLSTDAGPSLRVYGIVREEGAPVRLSDAWFDLIAAEGATTATWVSDTMVASLGSGNGAPAVALQDLGGAVLDEVAPVADAVAIVGGNGQSGLRVLTSEGNVRVLRGTAWQTTANGVSFLATQQ